MNRLERLGGSVSLSSASSGLYSFHCQGASPTNAAVDLPAAEGLKATPNSSLLTHFTMIWSIINGLLETGRAIRTLRVSPAITGSFPEDSTSHPG